MMGLNPKTQYKEMKRITKSLITRVIEIENPEDQSTKQLAWLGFAHWKPKNGTCSISFYPDLKPYLLQLKSHFTTIDMKCLFGLKSVFSLRIFELLIQYEKIGKRKLTVLELRSMLGIYQDEYILYGDFKRRIIQHSINEINAKTEYDISFSEIKESRRVIEIEFTIKKRTHFEKHQLEKAVTIQRELRSKNAVFDQLMEYGFSRETAKKFLQQNSEEIVRDALKSVDIQIERSNVKNPKAMLRTAIQERWKPEVYLSKKDKAKKTT